MILLNQKSQRTLRLLAFAILCLLLVFLSICSCDKKTTASSKIHLAGQDATKGTEADDRIFRGVEINPEGPIVDPLIRPYVDPEGKFIVAALEGRQADGTHGTVRLERDPDAGLCST